MTPEQIKKVLELHRLWLRADIKGGRANLNGANLRNANLRNADLSYASLSNANLNGANLRNANLHTADLSDADLNGANLRNANLSDADLSDADLNGADLSYANLSYADLSNANLSYANLRNTNLRNADLYILSASNAIGVDIQVINLNKHRIVKYQNTIQIGCQQHSAQYWLEKFKEIGIKNGYSEKEIKQYGNMIKLLAHSSFN